MALAVVSGARGQSTLYVDDSAPPGGTGLSWASPMNDLQAAIVQAAASGGTITEIHAGAGTYHPAGPGGSRTALFILRNNLAIRGGYAGFGAPNPEERDWVVHESILSGDLNGNDGPGGANRNENSYHVVGGSSVDATSVLEGFTITGGYANGSNPNDRGAAVFLFPFASNPTFRHCRFTGNEVLGKGGAMYTYRSTSIIEDCVFENNLGNTGGAVYHLQSTPEYLDCVFRNNESTGLAGAVYNYLSDTRLTRCRIEGNAALGGGAIANFQSAPVVSASVILRNSAEGGLFPSGGAILNDPGSPVLTNVLISGNHADLNSGAIHNTPNSHTLLNNCLLLGNHAGLVGGIGVTGGSVTLASTIVWGNTADAGSGQSVQIHAWDGTIAANYSCIEALVSDLGTGNISFDPGLADPFGADQQAGTGDEDIRLTWESPCIGVGDPAVAYDPAARDLFGGTRVLCGVVDMGPVEFGPGDYTCDHAVDLADWAAWTSCVTGPDGADSGATCAPLRFDQNATIDLADMAAFQQVFGW